MSDPASRAVTALRRTVLAVAGINFAYFFVEAGVALAIGSVSLFADSVDFLEDTALNVLVAMALGWSLSRRALAGRAMALVLLAPAAAAVVQGVRKVLEPEAPAPAPLLATALGAAAVNLLCAWLLKHHHRHGGSVGRAAFLSARNDVLVNAAIVAVALLTAATGSGWPDIVLGFGIVALAFHSAWEVWEAAGQERLAARALAGEDLG